MTPAIKSPIQIPRLKEPLPLSQHSWPPETQPLVTIRCSTYQHGAFIERAIQGFLIQRTNFPVQIIIHDDASTDGTAAIVRSYSERYPQLITSILQSKNQYSQGTKPMTFIRPLIKGQYIALCEGDDYWTHPDKLQLQADYLDTHPEVVLVFHDVHSVNAEDQLVSESKINAERPKGQAQQLPSLVEICSAFIPNLSTLKRNIEIPRLSPEDKIRSGDIFIFAMLADHGEFHQVGGTMGCHRVHQAGVWSSLSSEQKHREGAHTRLVISKYINPANLPQILAMMADRCLVNFFRYLRRGNLSTALHFVQQYGKGISLLFQRLPLIKALALALYFISIYPPAQLSKRLSRRFLHNKKHPSPPPANKIILTTDNTENGKSS